MQPASEEDISQSIDKKMFANGIILAEELHRSLVHLELSVSAKGAKREKANTLLT